MVPIEQRDRGISAYQALEECIREPGWYCLINSTRVKLCRLGKEILCLDLKAGTQNKQSDKHKHRVLKRNVELMSIPVCS